MFAAILPGSEGRVGRVVPGAEQALLLGGDEEEEDRAPRALAAGRERFREGEELGAAGGVVERAVVDRVALLVGGGRRPDGRDGRCRRRPRRAGRDPSPAGARRRSRSRPRGSGSRARGWCGCRAAPDGTTSTSRPRPGRRASARRARRASRRPLRSSSRTIWRRGSSPAGSSNCSLDQEDLHDLERIAGGGRGVDDDGAGRALPRGALVLVGPAAVVEPALAGEEGVVPVRIVVEHEQDLALEIDPLEVVPAVLRRLDAVADEDHLGVLDRSPSLAWTPDAAMNSSRRASATLPPGA